MTSFTAGLVSSTDDQGKGPIPYSDGSQVAQGEIAKLFHGMNQRWCVEKQDVIGFCRRLSLRPSVPTTSWFSRRHTARTARRCVWTLLAGFKLGDVKFSI